MLTNDNPKGKRPRIKAEIPNPVIDPLAYTNNLCSPNARKIKGFEEVLNIHFWIDKHYANRDQHGDENGKRDGIGME